MPRISRGIADGIIYHVLNRGNYKKTIFFTECDYRDFVQLMKISKPNFCIDIYAYCLMPNHFHIVVRPRRGDHMSKWVHWIMTTYNWRHRRYYQTDGHIWKGRYKNFIIQQNKYFLTALRYVERNPVRAGLVPSAKDWPWSSFRERIAESKNKIIDEPPLEIPDDWNVLVDTPLTAKELKEITYSVEKQAPFGNKNWKKDICAELDLAHTLRSRGRPRKKRREK